MVAGDVFVGFAEQNVNNSTGSAGDKRVRVRTKGLAELAVTGVTAVTDVSAPVYASDDATFTLTAGSNTYIGIVHRFVSSGVAVVMFDTPRPPGSIVEGDIGTGAVTTGKIGADAVDGSKIADASVSLEHLDSGIAPSHVVKYAGTFTWIGSGASKAATVSGVAASDVLICSIKTAPTEAGYIKSAIASTDTITVTLSAANTTNDAVISYVVHRAAA